MNNAKMWLVVKPTVGVPLFLTGVAVASLAVHVAVINSGVGAWYGPFVTGGSGAEASAAVETQQNVLPASLTDGMIVTLPDGTTARLVVDAPVTLAAAD